jgi:hypothetical protein
LHLEYSTWVDEVCSPFREFVDKLYTFKLEGGWKSVIGKLLMNNLYGKFSQSRAPNQLVPHEKYLAMAAQYEELPDSLSDIEELLDEEGNTQAVLIKPEGLYFPKHANQHWGSYITAAARIKLHRLMVKHNAFYVDTDSILTTDPLTETKELGALSLQQECRSAYLAGPKAYYLQGEDPKIRVKGVPNRAGYYWCQEPDGACFWAPTDELQLKALEGYEIAFDAPLKLLESFRRKTLPIWVVQDGRMQIKENAVEAVANFWHPHVKQLKLVSDKRIIPAGNSGWTIPRTIRCLKR